MTSRELAERLRVLVVTDRAAAGDRDVADVVERALRGGATAVQLRNKGDTARELVAVGRRVRELTRAHGALLFVNDRLDVALAVDADGVHVGPDDLPVAAVRKAVPRRFLVGRSADDPTVARAAVADGADYIGCGAVFGTTTKDVGAEAIGPEGVRRVAAAVDVPVVAIGGIDARGAAALAASGACGVAVVSAVMAAGDPEAATREIVEAVLGWGAAGG